MAVYSYQACPAVMGSGETSKVLSGTIAADSPHHARELLRERALDVIAVDQVRRPAGLAWLSGGPSTRPRNGGGRYEGRVVSFVRELSTLLAVGTPMLQALDTAIGPESAKVQSKRDRWLRFQRNRGFESVLLQVRDRVAAGAALSEAMGDHPGV
ncbi:MAG: hypothetical protein AAGI37_14040, partial [Planctomycetota bacterium]